MFCLRLSLDDYCVQQSAKKMSEPTFLGWEGRIFLENWKKKKKKKINQCKINLKWMWFQQILLAFFSWKKKIF